MLRPSLWKFRRAFAIRRNRILAVQLQRAARNVLARSLVLGYPEIHQSLLESPIIALAKS